MTNVIDVMAEDKQCKDLLVSINNGLLEETGDPCTYYITPDSVGKVEIIIKDKKSKNIVWGKAIFRVKELPNPEAFLSTKNSGEISKPFLKAQIGLIAVLNCCDIDPVYRMQEYTVTILRSNKLVFSGTSFQAKFPDEMKDALGRIEAGDKVFFTGIKVLAPYKKLLNLQPIEFLIVE